MKQKRKRVTAQLSFNCIIGIITATAKYRLIDLSAVSCFVLMHIKSTLKFPMKYFIMEKVGICHASKQNAL